MWQAAFIMLEEHEFVQWIVPLHQKDTIRRGTGQVTVTVVGIFADADSHAVARLRDTLRLRQSPRYQKSIQRKTITRLADVAMQPNQIVTIQVGRLARQRHQHICRK